MGKKSVILLAITLMLSSTALTGFSNAQTNVYNEITADTTWNAAGSPYVFTAPVTVNENVTLTIEPGVTIDMASFSLYVKGVLNARCNSSNPIIFDSESTTLSPSTTSQIFFEPSTADYNANDGTGCIIENAEINAAISINDSAPMIAGCQIKGGITITQAAPTITGNNISEGGAVYAINVENQSAPIISLNTITGKAIGIGFNLPDNGYASNLYDASVENNTIIDCLTGIGVGSSEGTILLNGNLIYGSDVAIQVGNVSCPVTIQHNLIMNNTLGIDIGAQVAIQENTIYNNTVGIFYQTTDQSLISYNNIMNNTQYNFEASTISPSYEIEAVYNFWGTQDIPTINQTIYDKNNNDSLGEVKYLPALDSPYVGAPVIPGVNMNPTTTPTPTVTPIQTNPAQTNQPTQTATSTPTTTPITQGPFNTIEIAIIILLSIVIAVTLIVAFKKGKKCNTETETKTTQ